MVQATAKSSNLIEKRVLIQASPETVFRALTEGSALADWFCDRAACDAREGGEMSAAWRSGRKTIQGRARITRLVPGEALELLWTDEGSGAPESNPTHRTAFSIARKKGVSEVTVRDRDDRAPDPVSFAQLSEGWNHVLFELKDHCEQAERAAKAHQEEKS